MYTLNTNSIAHHTPRLRTYLTYRYCAQPFDDKELYRAFNPAEATPPRSACLRNQDTRGQRMWGLMITMSIVMRTIMRRRKVEMVTALIILERGEDANSEQE